MLAIFIKKKKIPVASKNYTKPCFQTITKWAYTQDTCYLNLANLTNKIINKIFS